MNQEISWSRSRRPETVPGDHLHKHGLAAAVRSDAKARAERVVFSRANAGQAENSTDFAHMTMVLRHEQYTVTDFTDPSPREIEWTDIPLSKKTGHVDIVLRVVNFPKPLTGPEILEIGHYPRSVAGSAQEVRPSSTTATRKRLVQHND